MHYYLAHNNRIELAKDTSMKSLLRELRERKIYIALKGDDIKLSFDGARPSPALLTKIKDNKAAIVDYLKKEIGSRQGQKIASLNPDLEEGYPLSSAQLRLWVLSQMETGSASYNMPFQILLNENFVIELFEQAIQKVVERHEILRTCFRKNDQDEVRQWVIPIQNIKIPIVFEDVSDADDAEQLARQSAERDYYIPFDLEKAPLVRIKLIKITSKKWLFYFNMHHIISDGWSLEILTRDVMAFYQSILEKKQVSLPSLNIHYKDYATWQLTQLNKPTAEVHKKFWIEQLSGTLPILNLPGQRQRPRLKSNNGRKLKTYLDAELSAQIRAYVEERKGTLFMFLLASLKVLFFRYTNQEDIIIGSPVAGRDHADLKDQIGFYVNTLAIRNQIHGELSFSDFYEQVKDNLLEVYAHQIYPFDRLVDELNLSRDTSRSAVFDVLFVLQNIADTSANSLYNNQLNTIEDEGAAAAKFDMNFNITEVGAAIELSLVYNTDVYENTLMSGFLNHYKNVIKSILISEDQKISKLEFIAESEKSIVRYDFQTESEAKTLLDLFAEQVNEKPDTIALVSGEEKLTYRLLDERTNLLATNLQEQYNIQPDDLIGITLEPSQWSIIAILSVLKSGAAYVPVDPDTPLQRIKQIIDQTALKTLIVESTNQKKAQACSVETFVIDEVWESLKGNDLVKPIARIEPSNLAYVIFTSGSTGLPKGVMVNHANLVDYVKGLFAHTPVGNAQSFALMSSIATDLGNTVLYGALLSGGTLYLPAKAILRDVDEIHKYFTENTIDCIKIVPVHWKALTKEKQLLLPEKMIIFGGDTLSVSNVEAIRKQNSELAIVNHYGPTETTIGKLLIHLEQDQTYPQIPIGKPFSKTSIYVVDQFMNICPKGIPGELLIGGAGVAKGYIRNTELTAERFIPNPFVKHDEKLYRTGDLVRMWENGNIEFLGRIDNQIKIRGNRIELGEIENTILLQHGIKEVFVNAIQVDSDDKELVAYYIEKEEIAQSELRAHLQEHLPAFMLPSYFIKLEEFPLTSNGKIDKKQLPLPENLGLVSEAEFIAPESELEIQLAKIWGNILGRATVGVNDDFFVLGGHSLKAIRLINEYHKAFNIKLSFSDVFLHTTLEAHCNLIDSVENSEYFEIPNISYAEKYPVSDAQRRLWVLSQFENSSVAYNTPNFIYLDGNYDIAIYQKAILAVLERHEILRTIFQKDKQGNVYQRVLDISELDFKIGFENYTEHTDAKDLAFEFIRNDAYLPFDLENGPLLRVCILQTSANTYVLYYNIHHIISDGWSRHILARDISAYYQHLSKQTKLLLADLRIQYKDYASWQLTQLQSESFESHRTYWLNKLSGELPLLDLPQSKPRPALKTYDGQLVDITFPKKDTTAIRSFISEKGGTLYMFLLASLKALFHRYTGQEDMIIGSAVAGREHVELKDQIGFYVNTLALRTQFTAKTPFIDFYEQMKSETLKAYSHQAYPFDRLVEELNLQRDISRSVLFDVMLILQNTGEFNEEYTTKNEETGQLRNSGAIKAKFDLLFSFMEEEDSIRLGLEYNTDLYDFALIQQMVDHYQEIIKNIIGDEHCLIENLNYLPDYEREATLLDFNNTDVPYSRDETVIDLFEKQVAKTPDNIAIQDQKKSYTYTSLKTKSDAIAAFLNKELGSQNEPVGIILERNADLVLILLSVLKSGKAYIPIDPNLPEERVRYIIENSKTKVIIGDQNNYKEDKTSTGIKFYDIQLLIEKTTPKLDLFFPTAQDTAYIIYTSGSTGNPKGVEIGHRSLVNFLTSIQMKPGVNASDLLYAVTTYSFDISILEFFVPLISGATIYVASNETLSDPRLLIDDLEKTQPTILQATPSFYQMLFDANWKGDTKLKVLCGGDALNETLAKTLTNNVDELWNMYGPTETTIWSTIKKIEKPNESSNIGTPINNTQIYILDKKMNPVSVGIPGQVFIGGEGLAHGYFKNSKLSDERFLANPFIKESQALYPSDKIYNTGDLGRWLPDGSIEFLGRSDFQVKIRGHRIELGEIENVILQYAEAIKQVILKPVEIGREKVLVAYYTSEKTIDKLALKNHLASKLPRYMVPSFFKAMDTMPLTPNGKVDRKKLPDVSDEDIIRNEYVKPKSELEKAIVDLIKKEVGAQFSKIGITDNFFDLGLDSLSLMKILNQINTNLNVELKALDLFQYPNVQSLVKNMLNQDTKDEEQLSSISEDMDSVLDLF